MCVQRFDDFDLMVASDDGQYVLFEDYDLLDKQCEQQRATIQQQAARVKELEGIIAECVRLVRCGMPDDVEKYAKP